MVQEWLGPSYFFISLVLGPLNSLLEESTDPNRYTAKAKFCFCKNNKRIIIIPPTNEYGGTPSLHCPSLQKSATSDLNVIITKQNYSAYQLREPTPSKKPGPALKTIN